MMTERERVICADCGDDFWRDGGQQWRIRCVPCWLALKGKRPVKIDQAEAFNDLRAEIGSNIKPLLQLVHPDRNNNSETSTRLTQWLLSLRDRLGL